jgi:hypothetical protein
MERRRNPNADHLATSSKDTKDQKYPCAGTVINRASNAVQEPGEP